MAKGVGYGLGFVCFALVAAMAGATQFQVGGNNGWSVAGASAQSYNTWAMKNRFQIGDTLVFVYPNDQDSVLVVQPADYNACNTSSYDKKFTDGNTVFTLDRAGAFFFISGVDANCRANEKLIVMVLAGRNGNSSGSAPTASSPAAPPPASTTPAPATSPAPSASSPPPATATPPAPAPKAPSPTSAPPPASASAPLTPPSSAPAASSPPSAPPSSSPPSPTPSAPAGAPPMPPPANAPAGADGGSTNSTGASPPAGSSDQNSAGITVTGAAGLAACIVGYAMLAL